MLDFYDINIIPIILKRFKVKNIITCELNDTKLMEEINNYSTNFKSINSNEKIKADFNETTLKILPKLNNYEAIFLDDDPNWYTTYNELNIIKKNNAEFPLVFICNNIFPHKYRDSYKNPDIIPDEFKNKFTKQLLLNNTVKIRDDYYHAIEENTPKNGVSTALKDFLTENSSIGVMDIKFLNGITILYPLNSISQIRLSALSEELEGYTLNNDDLSDSIIENQLLSNYINISEDRIEVIDEVTSELNAKNQIISDFEKQVQFHDDEISFKDTQITGVTSQLSLKDTQIKNYESKLINRESEINELNHEINSLKIELNEKNQDYNSIKNELTKKETYYANKINTLKTELNTDFNQRESEFYNQISKANFEIKTLKSNIEELESEKSKLNSIKQQYTNQLSKLDCKEYCISCFKDEISNNHLEIEYLKNDTIVKKLLSPFAYIYLILKSNPKELSINLKLYKAIKNSKCFDIGYYLNNNKDLLKSKWCKYFSPELHYVCNGFKEERKFNKKYFNRNSKEELLDYIIRCQ